MYCFFFSDTCKKQSKELTLSLSTCFCVQLNYTSISDWKLCGRNIRSTQKKRIFNHHTVRKTFVRMLTTLKGRLSKAMVLETARYPSIQDGLNPITIDQPLIKIFQIIYNHSRVQQTRCRLMQHYWIFKCKAVVRQTVRQCIPCRRTIQEIHRPKTSDLPCERLASEQHFVFPTTRLDLIGLFPVFQFDRHATLYLLLFICLVVWAVHLEIAENLSTDSTMSFIRRFIGRRGKPRKVRSDNAILFVGSF